MYSGSYSHILVKLFQHLILICAGGDVTGLQAELERLASLAGASPDNKVPSIMIIKGEVKSFFFIPPLGQN